MKITQNQVKILRECQQHVDVLMRGNDHDACEPIFDVMNQTMVEVLGFDLTEQILSETAFSEGCDPVQVIRQHVDLLIVDETDVVAQIDQIDLFTRL